MAFIIKSWFNDTGSTATVSLDGETQFTVDPGHGHNLSPNWLVPVASSAAEYASNHITVTLDGNTVPFTFWANGGRLYYSQSDTWNDTQEMEVIFSSELMYQIQEAAEKPWIVGEIQDLG